MSWHRTYYRFAKLFSRKSFIRESFELDLSGTRIRKLTTKKKLARPVRIGISPGHGGKDLGCMGPNGTREADITRKICNSMVKVADKKIIDFRVYDEGPEQRKDYKMRVFRSNMDFCDYYLPIHLNWSPYPRTNGFFLMVYKEEKKRMSLGKAIADDFIKQFPISFKDYDGKKDGIMLRNSGRGVYELKAPRAITLYLELGFLSNPAWEGTMQLPGKIDDVAERLVMSMQHWFLNNEKLIKYLR